MRKGGLVATDLETGETVFQDFNVDEDLIKQIMSTLGVGMHFDVFSADRVDELVYGG